MLADIPLEQMAIFYPECPPHFNKSWGEREVFDALHSLDDSHTVLHSLPWLNVVGSRRLDARFPVQGEADFVVLSEKRGILVVEVKSGGIRCDGRTWHQINRATEEEIPIQDPIQQANISAHFLRKKIAQRLPGLKKIGVFHAVWFPSIEFDVNQHQLDCDRSIILDATDLASPAAAFDRAFNFWLALLAKKPLSSRDRDALLNMLAPSFRLVPTLRVAMQSREREFLRLTREQAMILDYLGEQQHALISGPAGSGKTMLAYELSRRLAKSGENVLFLCSPKNLRKHLNRNFRNGEKTLSEKNRISFCIPQAYVMEYFNSVSGPDRSAAIDVAEVEQMLLKDLGEGRRRIPNTVIDEGQDFSDAWIEGLRKCTTGRFFVFYDRNQAIFQPELPSWFQRAECRLNLKKVCRNTRQVAETAFRLVGITEFNSEAPDGPRPGLYLYSNPDQSRAIVKRILSEYVSEKHAAPQDIAVLTMRSRKTSHLATCEWPVLCSEEFDAKATCFTSVASFKGLERRIVIVVDVDLERIGENKYRRFLHLGCSRAIHELHIVASRPGARSLHRAIEALGGEFSSTPELKTLATLLAVDVPGIVASRHASSKAATQDS